ncbi:RNA polymerase sigma-70 factor [Herpetosiphon giganteus]|uniref:RNA polymerase sigma-70 factor n=1 Tax=Herpetosiphon giganteus TaxID=2029754 RepID=UPI00195E5D3E|nr:RNA polymerase sigma-70 factor [Herpetosiphon giganteus]MBM7845531.1 RNA polymerase sigma-70 factor (ECF subfamily) [Herpetosiphon giganteus]
MNQIELFESYRGYLFGIAYRMLGSVMDAEDCLQEVFLRWQSHVEAVANPRAWLATVATRWCLDQLNTARHQREQYIGEWLPEPLITPAPSSELEQAESLSTAFLVLLERLSPAERAVFLLHKVFGYEYSEIGEIVGKSAAACRQIGHRAAAHVAQARPRFNVEPSVQQRLSTQFLQSCATGDLESLMSLLAEDVVLRSDGGGVVQAARNPIYGPSAVGRFLLGVLPKLPANSIFEPRLINGQPGFVAMVDGHASGTLILDLLDQQIGGIYIMLNPYKLQHLAQ